LGKKGTSLLVPRTSRVIGKKKEYWEGWDGIASGEKRKGARWSLIRGGGRSKELGGTLKYEEERKKR